MINGSYPNSDILSERPTDRIQFHYIIQIDVPKSEQIRIIARPIPSDAYRNIRWSGTEGNAIIFFFPDSTVRVRFVFLAKGG